MTSAVAPTADTGVRSACDASAMNWRWVCSVARIRATLQTQRQFMADASHALRTPVSAVGATADVMLSRDHRHEAEYREAMAIAGSQARRLGRLVEDMLVLARADAGASTSMS